MKKIISALCFALLSTLLFTSCKKETTVKQTEPKDYQTSNMKMNYYGKTLEYTVKYSPSTKKLVVEGKDAKQVQEIVNSHPNALASVKSETEFTFYNHKNEFYNEEESNKNRLSSSVSNLLTDGLNVTFYKDINYYNAMRTVNLSNITTFYTFPVMEPCNAAANWCPTGATVSKRGEKNPWVGSGENDAYSSIKLYYLPNNNLGIPFVVNCILYEDANYGGGAIQFNLASTIGLGAYGIVDLKRYKNNIFLKTWNDRASSYQVYF